MPNISITFIHCHLTRVQASQFNSQFNRIILTSKAPNTTIAEFANTVDPEERAHNEPSLLDLQCLPSSL